MAQLTARQIGTAASQVRNPEILKNRNKKPQCWGSLPHAPHCILGNSKYYRDGCPRRRSRMRRCSSRYGCCRDWPPPGSRCRRWTTSPPRRTGTTDASVSYAVFTFLHMLYVHVQNYIYSKYVCSAAELVKYCMYGRPITLRLYVDSTLHHACTRCSSYKNVQRSDLAYI
jgi:hypothetical protein